MSFSSFQNQNTLKVIKIKAVYYLNKKQNREIETDMTV